MGCALPVSRSTSESTLFLCSQPWRTSLPFLRPMKVSFVNLDRAAGPAHRGQFARAYPRRARGVMPRELARDFKSAHPRCPGAPPSPRFFLRRPLRRAGMRTYTEHVCVAPRGRLLLNIVNIRPGAYRYTRDMYLPPGIGTVRAEATPGRAADERDKTQQNATNRNKSQQIATYTHALAPWVRARPHQAVDEMTIRGRSDDDPRTIQCRCDDDPKDDPRTMRCRAAAPARVPISAASVPRNVGISSGKGPICRAGETIGRSQPVQSGLVLKFVNTMTVRSRDQ